MTELIGMEEQKLTVVHAALNKEFNSRKIRVMEVPEFKQIVLKHLGEGSGQKETTISDKTARKYMKEQNIFTERQYKRVVREKISELANLSSEEICQKYNLSVEERDLKDHKSENPEKKDEVIVKPDEEKSSSSFIRKRKRDSEKL